MAGLTDTGLVIRSIPELLQMETDAIRASLGETLAVLPESPEGILAAAMAELYGELWELLQTLYNEMDPDFATGQSLYTWGGLTGTNVEDGAPTQSKVTQTQTGDPGTLIPAGQLVRAPVTAVRFVTNESLLLGAVDGWTANTSTLIGKRVTNVGNVYQALSGGTTGSSGGPQGTGGSSILDGTVLWRFIGAGTAAGDQKMLSEVAGRIQGLAGTLTEIVNPLTGWLGTRNLLDAEMGRAAETPEQFRIRRRKELKARGAASVDAIYAPVSNVPGVTAVSVFNNRGDVVDGNGIGPHGVLVLVEGGNDAEVRQAIFKVVGAGTGTYGNVTGYAVDSKGNGQPIAFSRPIPVVVYVTVNLIADLGVFPKDGSEQVKRAVAYYGAARGASVDVVASIISKDVQTIPGILDVPVSGGILIGTAPNPSTSFTIGVGVFQRAVYDTSRVTVNVTAG
jgi:uncharacterized phage protein gp47/JayE